MSLSWQVTHFIQKDGAIVRQLEAAATVLDGTAASAQMVRLLEDMTTPRESAMASSSSLTEE